MCRNAGLYVDFLFVLLRKRSNDAKSIQNQAKIHKNSKLEAPSGSKVIWEAVETDFGGQESDFGAQEGDFGSQNGKSYFRCCLLR